MHFQISHDRFCAFEQHPVWPKMAVTYDFLRYSNSTFGLSTGWLTFIEVTFKGFSLKQTFSTQQSVILYLASKSRLGENAKNSK